MTNVIIVKKKEKNRRSRLGKGCEASCHRDWLRANHFSRYSCESDRIDSDVLTQSWEHLEGVPSEESSAYLSKSALQERTAPTAVRCRFKASAQSQGLIPIWGGGRVGGGGLLPMLLTCLSAPSKKALRRRQMECMWKVTKLEWERGLLRSGWPRRAPLPGPFRAATFVDDMKHRVNVRACEGSISSGPSPLPIQRQPGCEKNFVLLAEISRVGPESFDLCRNNSQTEKTPVAKNTGSAFILCKHQCF